MKLQSIFLLVLYLFTYYNGTAQINNTPEDEKNSYDLTLNITNIKSKGNLFIQILTDSLAYSSNTFHLKQSYLRRILIKIISLK
jgi:hypothetical protein